MALLVEMVELSSWMATPLAYAKSKPRFYFQKNHDMIIPEDKRNAGFEPAYQTKFEGTGNRGPLFDKNLARLHKLCKKCSNFIVKNAKLLGGKHCKLKPKQRCTA